MLPTSAVAAWLVFGQYMRGRRLTLSADPFPFKGGLLNRGQFLFTCPCSLQCQQTTSRALFSRGVFRIPETLLSARSGGSLKIVTSSASFFTYAVSLSILSSRLVAETGAATASGLSAILSVFKRLWAISTASNLRARATASLTDFGISFKSCTWIEEDETPWINWLRIRTSRCMLLRPTWKSSTYVTHQCIRLGTRPAVVLEPETLPAIPVLCRRGHNDTLNTRVPRHSPRTKTTRTGSSSSNGSSSFTPSQVPSPL